MKRADYLPRLFAWISLRQATAETRLTGIFLLYGADKLEKEPGKPQHRLALAWGQERPRLHTVGQTLTEVAGNMKTEKYIQKPVIL